MQTIGERIEERRLSLGLKKTDVWKAAKRSSGAYTHWMNGGDLESEALFGVAKVLKVTPESLRTGKNWPEELDRDSNPSIDILALPLMNAYGSMGGGSLIPDQEVVVDMLRVSRSWVDKNIQPISSIANLAFIHAIGDSMMPTFNDGDILLVDTGTKSVRADKIYVLEAHNRLFIKRVRQRIDGVFEVSSDNPAVKTVDILNCDHEVQVKGLVVWVWNGKRV